MTCKFCGADNRDGAKFCENCGAAIAVPTEATTPVEDTVNVAPEENTPENTTPAPQAYQPYTSYQPPAMNEQGYQPYNPNAYQPQAYVTPQDTGTPPANGLAIASLVCGILSFFCCGMLLGILAIVFGIIAKSQGNKSAASTAGIICGAVGLVLSIVGIVLIVAGSLLSTPELMY